MNYEGCNIFVSGQTGSGKSYLVRHEIVDSWRLVVWCPKPEEHDYPGVTFDMMRESRGKFIEFWRHCVGGRFRLIYRPRDKFDFEEFDALCRLVYTCGNMTFVVEEVGSTVPARVFQRTDAGRGFKTLLTAGRTRDIETWIVNQRPSGVPVEIKSECRKAFIFKTLEPPDQDYIRDRFGVAAYQALLALGPYEHVEWREDGAIRVGKA